MVEPGCQITTGELPYVKVQAFESTVADESVECAIKGRSVQYQLLECAIKGKSM